MGETGELDDPADVQVGQQARRVDAVRRQDRHHFVFVGVVTRRRDQVAAIVEPRQVAVADAIRRAVLRDRALPVGEGERLAAGGDGETCPIGVQLGAVEIAGGGDEAPVALGARAAKLDFQAPRLVGPSIEHVQVGAGVKHEPLAVGGHVARVEILEVRMAGQLSTLDRAGVHVPVALVVGQEEDALATPAGTGQVAVEPHQRHVAAAGIAVDPERAGRPAAIALPGGGFARGLSPEHRCATRAVGKGGRRPERELGRQAAAHRHAVEPLLAGKGPGGDGCVDDRRSVGRPGGHGTGRALERQPLGRAAAGGHDVDLRRTLLACHEGDRPTVRREARPARLAGARGQPTRVAAADVDAPQVVLADEDDGPGVDGRVAEVARTGAHPALAAVWPSRSISRNT